MRPKNQVVAPKTRRAERIFDELLLFLMTLLVLSFFSFFLLTGYGIKLLLSEPNRPPDVEQNQKSEIGLKVREGEFEATFNEKALYDLSFLDKQTSFAPQPIPGQLMPLLHEPAVRKMRFASSSEGQASTSPLINENPLKDFRVGLREGLLVMTLPVRLGDTQKTITIEEKLKVENKELVADVRGIKIGELPVPRFLTTYVLDSFAPNFLDFAAQRILPKIEGQNQQQTIPVDLKQLKLSKLIMPPTLLLLFGPRDSIKSIIKENESIAKILDKIPKLEVHQVEIGEDKLTVNGGVHGVPPINLPETVNPLDFLQDL